MVIPAFLELAVIAEFLVIQELADGQESLAILAPELAAILDFLVLAVTPDFQE